MEVVISKGREQVAIKSNVKELEGPRREITQRLDSLTPLLGNHRERVPLELRATATANLNQALEEQALGISLGHSVPLRSDRLPHPLASRPWAV
jgi:hypothetical protein